MKVISKELLSEVLGVRLQIMTYRENIQENGNVVTYTYANDTLNMFKEDSINIHELAHKVKEWAIGLGYTLTSSLHSNGSMCLAHEHNAEFEDYSHKALSNTKFEPETILMVGELILENRS